MDLEVVTRNPTFFWEGHREGYAASADLEVTWMVQTCLKIAGLLQ